MVEEARPPLLDEVQERLAVSKNRSQRPFLELRLAAKPAQQPRAQVLGNDLSRVVKREEQGQKVGVRVNIFGGHPEDAAQDEVAGLVVAERSRSRLILNPEERHPPVGIEGADDRAAQLREEILDPE